VCLRFSEALTAHVVQATDDDVRDVASVTVEVEAARNIRAVDERPRVTARAFAFE